MVGVQERATDGGTLLMQATYVYDVFGNRIEKDVWTQASGTTTTTRFGYDGQNVWVDLDGSNALQSRYLTNDEVDALFASIGSTGLARWYLRDRLGSIRNVTDGSGNLVDTITYDGFGNIASESNSSAGGRYKFTNREFDAETGLQYNRARYYDPKTGQWTTEDPLGHGAGDPNLRRYVGNSSTNFVDPTGLRRDPGDALFPGGMVLSDPEAYAIYLEWMAYEFFYEFGYFPDPGKPDDENAFFQFIGDFWQNNPGGEWEIQIAALAGIYPGQESAPAGGTFLGGLGEGIQAGGIEAISEAGTFALSLLLHPAATLGGIYEAIAALVEEVQNGNAMVIAEAILGPELTELLDNCNLDEHRKGYLIGKLLAKRLVQQLMGSAAGAVGGAAASTILGKLKKGKLGKKVVKLTGQVHHAISKRVHDQLQKHPILKDMYKRRDRRWVKRAKDLESHKGYQKWHRELDKEIVQWLKDHPKATPAMFENYLIELYNRLDLLERFPLGFGIGITR